MLRPRGILTAIFQVDLD